MYGEYGAGCSSAWIVELHASGPKPLMPTCCGVSRRKCRPLFFCSDLLWLLLGAASDSINHTTWAQSRACVHLHRRNLHACLCYIASQLDGRKMNSKIARLKRYLERVGIKGVGEIRESAHEKTSKSGSTGRYGVGDGEQQDANHNDILDLTFLAGPSLDDSALATSHVVDRLRGTGIVARLSPKGKSTALSGGGHFSWDAGVMPGLPLTPKGVRSLGVGGRKRSVWTLGRTGQRDVPPAVTHADTATEIVATAALATVASSTGRSDGNTILSPTPLVERAHLASPPGTDESAYGRSARRMAHSRSNSPVSRAGGGGQQRQTHRPSGSPVRSVDGSASSQARGLRRLTRRLSFRQRQAQANIQVLFTPWGHD